MIQPVNYQQMPQMYQPTYQPMYCQPQVPQNNAVKIDIINPQAGVQPGYSPYAMPQSSVYAPMATAPMAYPMPYPMMMPAPQQMQQPVQVPQQPVAKPDPVMVQPAPAQQPVAETTKVAVQPQQTAQPAPQPVAPQPVIIPPTVVPPTVVPPTVVSTAPQQVINNAPQPPMAPTVATTPESQPQVAVQPQPVPVAQPQQPTPVATPQAETTQAPATQKPVVEEPVATPVNIDLNKIVSGLQANSLDEQLLAIENIADTAQKDPNAATQLLDTQVMDALGNIIKRDTTQMQGPTPEQIDLRQKLIAGEKLTPEQETLAKTVSEMETAERNKQYALYTVAILQKLLSDKVSEMKGQKLELKDYPMINDVVKIAKADNNPLLRASALAALSYVADASNKDLLTTMFEQSKKDADPNVAAVATEALKNLANIQ